MNEIAKVADAVHEMNRIMHSRLRDKKSIVLWENTFIRKQIYRREQGESFSLDEHIRAMVYSMISSQMSWKNVEKYVDATSKITCLEEIFYGFNHKEIMKHPAKDYQDGIKKAGLAGISTKYQIDALLDVNIPKLLSFEKEYDSIDAYYSTIISNGNGITSLIRRLASSNSNDKFKQMAEALVAEYLRNVGYDIAKPDRHIRRILDCNHLNCSDRENVQVYEAFDIVADIAKAMGKHTAEVDYTMWLYCATGYGLCTKNNPACDECSSVINSICNYQ